MTSKELDLDGGIFPVDPKTLRERFQRLQVLGGSPLP
jgi:hypothetical protein